MGKDAVTTAGPSICEQPAGLPDFSEIHNGFLVPEALAKAFGLAPPQQRLDVPAFQQPWHWHMDALLLQHMQANNGYPASALMPIGAGLGPFQSYGPYLGHWLPIRDPAQLPLQPRSMPYYPCPPPAGAAQIPCPWGQRLPENANVLPGRVPASQAAPGWPYSGALPFPQGPGCDIRGAAMQGTDYNGTGVNQVRSSKCVCFAAVLGDCGSRDLE
jgi:hypothetical protein